MKTSHIYQLLQSVDLLCLYGLVKAGLIIETGDLTLALMSLGDAVLSLLIRDLSELLDPGLSLGLRFLKGVKIVKNHEIINKSI